ncbi:MAG: phospholipase family protein [Paenibacillus sp.]|jgi:phosphatidylserine/phosphatidylglycerophosphate/cardiolipin synthase-like enzyme|nr:phospholipase family protein [Paenibacillus sp.]
MAKEWSKVIRKSVCIFLISSIVANIILFKYIHKLKVARTVSIENQHTMIDYSFSGLNGDPQILLIQVINGTISKLQIAIYNLDDEEIVNAIMKAKERGVSIQILTDEENADNKDTKVILTKFHKENIPIKINAKQKMHLKLTISDNKTAVVGSYNYTNQSAKENQELILAIHNGKLGTEWGNLFDEMWTSETNELWGP